MKQVKTQVFGEIEESLPCMLVVGGLVEFSVQGIDGLDTILTRIITPWNPTSGWVTVEYDESVLPEGVELVSGSIICPVCSAESCCSDGDKGDITVSNLGTQWDINEEAVTTGKIADAAVTTDKLADASVTHVKLADMPFSGIFYVRATANASGTAGKGRDWDPYVCSAAGSLKTLLEDVSKIPNGALVIISDGEYDVGDGVAFEDRDIWLRGLNREGVILKLGDDRAGGGASYAVLNFNYSLTYDISPNFVRLENMTLDANYGNQVNASAITCGAARFLVKEIFAKDVNVINCGNAVGRPEAFYFSAISQAAANPLHAIFDNICFEDDLTVSGAESSALFIGGQTLAKGVGIGSGVMHNCRVTRVYGVGLGASQNIQGLEITGCYVDCGATGYGYLHDVRESDNVIIHDNRFIGATSPDSPLMILGNYNTSTGAPEMSNYRVTGNVFFTRFGAQNPGNNQACIRVSHGPRNLLIEGNRFLGLKGVSAPAALDANQGPIVITDSPGNAYGPGDISVFIRNNGYDPNFYTAPCTVKAGLEAALRLCEFNYESAH